MASRCVVLDGNVALSLSESIVETCSVVLTFESVDEILWCDHSNKKPLQQYFCIVLFVFQYFTK